MSTQGISETFGHDHDRLDQLFHAFQEKKHSDFAQAKSAFKEFKTGLQRHIVWEETILFPVFERKTGIIHGPTSVMRAEHRRIGALLEAIHDQVRVNDPSSDEGERQLLETLGAHNQKEEHILYPAIDRLVTDEERAEMLAAMERVPPEAYTACCGHHAAAAS